ncbi:MAG: transglutaminase family protein [Lachnospiraceae bacterium]|nr:transglutaminase family protein [Lachnospiraceae bacterium]
MKYLAFFYETKMAYSSQVSSHYFSIKALPETSIRQKVEELHVTVSPMEELFESRDAFGNRILGGHTLEPHADFQVVVEGKAYVNNKREQGKAGENLALYKRPTSLTEMSDEMKEYVSDSFIPDKMKQEIPDYMPYNAFGIGDYVMKKLYQDFSYESGVTNIKTTAAQAFLGHRGVCQDYAHIMLAFLRFLGYSCRYVTGFMIGEGATHAWIEVYNEEDNLWYGLDPTNNLWIDENYIVLARGRDYKDCIVNKGRFLGLTEETQEITLKVEEIK